MDSWTEVVQCDRTVVVVVVARCVRASIHGYSQLAPGEASSAGDVEASPVPQQ
jgi:hypothetical protein